VITVRLSITATLSGKALRLNLDPAYPDEKWGFTAQQAVEECDLARPA